MNLNLVVNSRFKPFSYQELLAPALMATQAHQDIETQYADLDTKASVWENMANEQTDPYAYKMYKKYSDDLRNAADQLAQSGLSPSSRKAMLNLKARYSQEITPIEQAYAARKEQAKEQQQAMLQDPTLLLSRRAATTSLDDYIRNPQLAYESYSGKLLTAQAATAVQALTKQMRDNPRKWRDILHGAYYETLMQKGFTSQDVLEAIQRSPQAKQELLKIMDDVVGSSKIATWKDPEALRRAYEYVGQGLWSGVGETQYQMVQNPDHLNALQRAQLSQIRQQQQDRALKMNDPNLTDFYSQSEVATKNKEVAKRFNRFIEKGWMTKNGQITEEGLKALSNTKNLRTGKGTALYQSGKGLSNDEGKQLELVSSLRAFAESQGFKYTGNRRQDILGFNNAMKRVKYNIENNILPMGDIQFKVVRIPVTADQSKQLASQISTRLEESIPLYKVGKMSEKNGQYSLSQSKDMLTPEEVLELANGEYKDGNIRIANIVGVPSTNQTIIELSNGSRYIAPEDIFSDAARIGKATGYAASMVQDATPQQKAFGITYGNTYLSSILNTTKPQQTEYIDSNATIIP